MGAQTTDVQGVADLTDEEVAVELARGDVDRHVERVAEHVPRRHLVAGFTEDPRADLANVARSFEDRNEIIGLDDAFTGVAPTQQSLHTHDGEVLEIVDGLVDKEELMTREGGA